jgi:hypothetical protein
VKRFHPSLLYQNDPENARSLIGHQPSPEHESEEIDPVEQVR